MNRIIAAAAATILSVGALAACDVSSGSLLKDDTSNATHSTTSAEPASDDDTAPPKPNPDGTYTSTCDYLLGSFGGGTPDRFVADAKIHNTGNIGIVFELRATWFLAGGSKATSSKKYRLEPGQRRRVGLERDATSQEISAHQSLGYGKNCKAKVAMVDTFGEAQG